MAEKDIWTQLDEYQKKYPDVGGDSDEGTKPKKKKPPKANDYARGLLGNAIKKKNRQKYLDSSIKKALGKS